MRELTVQEMEQVCGAGVVTEFATTGGVYGTMGGAILTNTLRGASIGGLFGAVMGGSLGAGYAAGTWLYDEMS